MYFVFFFFCLLAFFGFFPLHVLFIKLSTNFISIDHTNSVARTAELLKERQKKNADFDDSSS
jgi:hypothetical protein